VVLNKKYGKEKTGYYIFRRKDKWLYAMVDV
jgi:hypothetical protein